MPAICVDPISDEGNIQPVVVEIQEKEAHNQTDNEETPHPSSDKSDNDVLSSELVSFEPSKTQLDKLPSPNKDSDIAIPAHKTTAPRLTATCTSTVAIHVTPSEDADKDEMPKRRSSPPVILAAIAYPGEDDGDHVDEIVLPYNRPVHDVIESTTNEETHEEPPPSQIPDKSSVISSNEEIHLARHDSLGVPPVYVGEVSFPGSLETRPPPPPYSVAIKDVVTPRHLPSPEKTISNLEVPQIATAEVSFPPLRSPLAEFRRQEQIANRRESIATRRLGNQRVRPRSLDIPIIITTAGSDAEEDNNQGDGKRKHISILKRSSSIDRPDGQKKSVTFSPDVPPESEDSKRGTSRQRRRVCKRQKAISRSHSQDSPDPTIPHVEFDFGSFLTTRREDKPPPTYEEFLSMSPPLKSERSASADRDTFTRASRIKEDVNKDKVSDDDRRWPHPFSQTVQKKVDKEEAPPTTADDDDAIRKSAKDRFFEACGAKAVISVLCTQESISEPSGIRIHDQISMSDQESTSSFTAGSTVSIVSITSTTKDDQMPDVTYTATRPLSDEGAAKTRFFGVKEDELLTSQLFSQAVRISVSVDSDTVETEKLSAPNSPTLVEEEEPPEDGDEDTSAKSRFLLSCEDEDTSDEASITMETDVTTSQQPDTVKGKLCRWNYFCRAFILC